MLDSNVLVLLIVGLASPDMTEIHKRTEIYRKPDFENLRAYVSRSSRVLVTSAVLAEASNLVKQTNAAAAEILIGALKEILFNIDEVAVSAKSAAGRPEFISLGYTDATLLEAAKSGATLLTADWSLYRAALICEYAAENFYHLRGEI